MIFAYSTKIMSKDSYTNLWGNKSAPPLLRKLSLVIKLDLDAEPIVLISIDQANNEVSLGELNPGEVFAYSLDNIKAISAKTKLNQQDTMVMCALIETN